MDYLKVDLHTHTRHSRDAIMTPARLLKHARDAGLDRIAITDHNTIVGAREAAAMDPAFVIIGQEVDMAGGGHVIGLFLRESIPAGLSLDEIATRVRDQGGLLYAPHPFAQLRRGLERGRSLVAAADIVEVHNARAFLPAWNRRAADAARSARLPIAAGSDSHFPHELGSAWTEMPPFHDVAGFRAALPLARPVVNHPPRTFVHVRSLAAHAVRTLTRR